MVVIVDRCVGYFSHYCDRILDKSNLCVEESLYPFEGIVYRRREVMVAGV